MSYELAWCIFAVLLVTPSALGLWWLIRVNPMRVLRLLTRGTGSVFEVGPRPPPPVWGVGPSSSKENAWPPRLPSSPKEARMESSVAEWLKQLKLAGGLELTENEARHWRWHREQPPKVGWWLCRLPGGAAWSWWDGKQWSAYARKNGRLPPWEYAEIKSRRPQSLWCYYWPKDAIVPRF